MWTYSLDDAWREQPTWLSAPDLAMSAYAARPRADELGTDAFVPKPFEPDRLLRELDGLLRAS
ncbi:MAG: hypothetical protein M3N47_15060 [Chloroflexota bacterium]|nr:hypothetical protein [Chloroflexota bacterium]